MLYIALFIVGFGIATISSMVGLGGGVFLVPILSLVFGLPLKNAIGVSIFTMTFSTISATLAYVKQKKINYKVGLLLDILDIPGVILGSYLTTIISSNLLSYMFGILLFIISLCTISEVIYISITSFLNKVYSFVDDISNKMRKKTKKYILSHMRIKTKKFGLSIKTDLKYLFFKLPKRVVLVAVVTSFLSGFVGGMLGAGGGTVDESVMILVLKIPIHMAAATSVFAMTLTNTVAAISHLNFGNILFEYAIPLGVGSIFGSQFGSRLSKRTKPEKLKKLLAVVFALIGLRMILF